MRNSTRPDLPLDRLGRRSFKPLVLCLALIFVAAACGGDDEIDTGADPESELPTDGEDGATDQEDDESGGDDDAAGDDTTGSDVGDGAYQPTEAQPDMISGQPAPIEEIRTIDEQTIGVRYQNGSEPCSLADVTVTESDTEITVALQTGLHPNAAAMSCIAQVLGYEIQVELDAPIGDRSIVAVEV